MLHLYQDRPIGGADILNSLADVNINNPENKQIIYYDQATGTWRNYAPPFVNSENVLHTIEECAASTNPEDVAGASVASLLNSALTDVKETVTANELGTYVNISSYTSDWYTCPSDGYIHIRCNTAGTTMQAQITGSTGGVDLYLKAIGASGGVFDSVSVRKGMKVKMIKIGSGDAYGYFVPLE